MSVLGAIRSNRQLALLEASWAVITFARWALMILVALYSYRKGGAAAVGVVAMVRVLPSAFTAPRLALFADLHSRRDVLLVSCLARGLLTVAMTGVVAMHGSLVLLLRWLPVFWSLTGFRSRRWRRSCRSGLAIFENWRQRTSRGT